MKQREDVYAVVINKGYGFVRKKSLAKELDCSQSKIDKMIPEVRKQIKKGRYSPYAICGDLYSVYVFLDYNKYRNALNDPYLCKTVPDFQPFEIAELCGFNQRLVEAT